MHARTRLVLKAYACLYSRQKVILLLVKNFWVFCGMGLSYCYFYIFWSLKDIKIEKWVLQINLGWISITHYPQIDKQEQGWWLGYICPLASVGGHCCQIAELRAGTGSFAAIFCPTKRPFWEGNQPGLHCRFVSGSGQWLLTNFSLARMEMSVSDWFLFVVCENEGLRAAILENHVWHIWKSCPWCRHFTTIYRPLCAFSL